MARPRKKPGEFGKITVRQMRPGSWRAETSIRDGAGRRHRVQGSGATEADAVAALRVKAHAIWHGLFMRISTGDTIGSLGTLWIAQERDHRRDLKVSTLDKYEKIVTMQLKEIREVRLEDVDSLFIDNFLQEIVRSQSASTAKLTKHVLKEMLKVARRHGAMPSGIDPMLDVKRIIHPKKRPENVLTEEQTEVIGRLMRSWDGLPSVEQRTPPRDPSTLTPRAMRRRRALGVPEEVALRGGRVMDTSTLRDVFALIRELGTRPGETLAIRHQDIAPTPPDVRERTGCDWMVLICGTVKRDSVHGLHRQGTPKHDNQVRWLVLSPGAEEVLLRRRAAYQENADALVFVTSTGNMYEPNNIAADIRRFREANSAWLIELGVDPETFTLKSLRKAKLTQIAHTYGSEYAAAWGGHSNVKITNEHYIERQVPVLAPSQSAGMAPLPGPFSVPGSEAVIPTGVAEEAITYLRNSAEDTT